MKGAIAWFAENHVAANLLMFFLLLGGIATGLIIKLEVFPESTMDRISITTEYFGASPAEVEEAINSRIEEKVAGLAGIKRIDSTAYEGFGTVVIEVMKGWDLQNLLDEVKAEVDRITTFPAEAEKPIVRELTRRTQVIDLAVYGDAPESTIKNLAETIKDDITNLPGITLAELMGVRKREIHIEISEDTLRRYGLTLGMVAIQVQRASFDLPAGSVKTRSGEILIRTKGRRYHADDYRDVAVITRPDGTKVTLDQIATLRDGFEDADLFARFQGKPAAVIQIFRIADQNALSVADSIKLYIDEIRPGLPEGVGVAFFADMSKILRSRIRLLLKNMNIGLILVSGLLGVLLNRRLAFWVTLGIPISFMAGVFALPSLDVSINMVSLFAFIMVLGIVVDDAIIIGENIFQKLEQGMAPLEASIEGATEVGRPVIFSVLTTVVAFAPLLLAGGMMGNIMRNIPIVVIVVLLGSLIESLFILPAHLAGRKRGADAKPKATRSDKASARWLRVFIKGPYARMLDRCLRWRYATLGIGLFFLLVTLGTWTGGILKFTFFPRLESDVLECAVTMPAGTPVERTIEVVDRLEQAAREAIEEVEAERKEGAPPLFEHSVAIVGIQMAQQGPHAMETGVGGHLGTVYIQLLEGEERDMSATRLTSLWREKVGPIADAETVLFKSELFSAGNAVEVHLSIDDQDELVEAADALKEELGNYPGVFDVADSFLPGKREMQLKLKPTARSLGLTLDDLARQVRHAFYGAEALRFQLDQDEVKVLVRYPDDERRSLGHLEAMRIRTPDGVEVPFSQVAEVTMEQGYVSVQRAQRLRVIKVTADVDETVVNANEVRLEVESKILPALKELHPALRYTIEGEGKEQEESFADVGRGFIFALFGIYTLLAIPFRSFTQPLVVMLAIPFGLVGALTGHLVMGYDLSMLSLFGMVGLAGVVVNDSLVLIDAANRIRREGVTATEAITRAGTLRFRAIILTSLTTFAGLMPMILERSLQAKFLIPMAISLGFGVLFATGITLLLIPCGYLILEDIQEQVGRAIRWLMRQLFGRDEDGVETEG